MHLVGNNSSMQPTQLITMVCGYLHFFMMCIYKHCFPPMLLVFLFAMKCCTEMPCPLPHNHYCCMLPSPICLPHLFICTCLISLPIACPPSSVLCWCLFNCIFFIFATCYISLWLHFGLFVYIFSFVSHFDLILLEKLFY